MNIHAGARQSDELEYVDNTYEKSLLKNRRKKKSIESIFSGGNEAT